MAAAATFIGSVLVSFGFASLFWGVEVFRNERSYAGYLGIIVFGVGLPASLFGFPIAWAGIRSLTEAFGGRTLLVLSCVMFGIAAYALKIDADPAPGFRPYAIACGAVFIFAGVRCAFAGLSGVSSGRSGADD